jgi:hypothetical protein
MPPLLSRESTEAGSSRSPEKGSNCDMGYSASEKKGHSGQQDQSVDHEMADNDVPLNKESKRFPLTHECSHPVSRADVEWDVQK